MQIHLFARRRMFEDQTRGVEQLMLQAILLDQRIGLRAVNRVTDNRVAQQVAMDAQLMCAPG